MEQTMNAKIHHVALAFLALAALACDEQATGRRWEQVPDRSPTNSSVDAGLVVPMWDLHPWPTDAEPLVEGAPSADTDAFSDPDAGPACLHYTSGSTDYAPVQTVGPQLSNGMLLPPGYSALQWSEPTITPDYTGAFAGWPGAKASHEGMDFVVGSSGPVDVPIYAAADGVVVYVRLGCPQVCGGDPRGMFCPNTAVRECGAGWGNHVVVEHAGGIFTRYAHLAPGSVTARVGVAVNRGDQLALMGNSGRSDTRHLHFELGTRTSAFDPCAASSSFDLVFDPAQLPW